MSAQFYWVVIIGCIVGGLVLCIIDQWCDPRRYIPDEPKKNLTPPEFLLF